MHLLKNPAKSVAALFFTLGCFSAEAELIYDFSIETIGEYYKTEEGESSHIYADSELILDYAFTPEWQATLEINHGPSESPETDEHFRFETSGSLYVSEAYVKFQGESHSFTIGKFEPLDGTFWHASTYFGNLNSRFSPGETIAISLDLGLDEETNHHLAAYVFYVDNSELAQSAFRKRFVREDYGDALGETGKLNNYALALYSQNRPINYTLAYAYMHHEEDEDPSSRVALAALHTPLDDEEDTLNFAWSLELIHSQSDDDEEEFDSVTLGIDFKRNSWSGGMGFGYLSDAIDDERHNRIAEFEINYDITENWFTEFAIRRIWAIDEDTLDAAIGVGYKFGNS